MKKIILLSAGLLTGILVLLAFSSNRKAIPATRPVASIIECLPPASPVLMTTAAFNARYQTNVVWVRKNVDNISQRDINAIKVGILKMRALPYTDPTSWEYQVAIHGTSRPDNLPSWNSCHRAGESVFFLAWHRMYTYFFERILRAKSGRAELTLPYWDYQTNPVLHPAYRDKALGNPLYDASRSAAINNGGALPASIMTAFENSLSIIPYYTFQSNMNGGPHGSVHTSVGGNMAVVSTAAKDPVFWLHHSNIDRLWEEWLSMCDGRANPIEATWLNKAYTFFDELGNAVTLTGSQVVEISNQLNYRYDNLSPVINCPPARTRFVSRQTLLRRETAVQIDGSNKKADFTQSSPTELETFMRSRNRGNFNFRNASEPERLVMIFEGVRIQHMPEGAMEVYLNLPPGVSPTSSSDHFVGLLDLFSAEHHSNHSIPGHDGDDEIELDATKAAQALGLTLPELRNAVVSFLVRGATINGVETTTEAQVTIRRIRFDVDRFQN